jgi:hypothetical protein
VTDVVLAAAAIQKIQSKTVHATSTETMVSGLTILFHRKTMRAVSPTTVSAPTKAG